MYVILFYVMPCYISYCSQMLCRAMYGVLCMLYMSAYRIVRCAMCVVLYMSARVYCTYMYESHDDAMRSCYMVLSD